MLYTIMHGKIHRATVTEANLEYMGSVTIDKWQAFCRASACRL